MPLLKESRPDINDVFSDWHLPDLLALRSLCSILKTHLDSLFKIGDCLIHRFPQSWKYQRSETENSNTSVPCGRCIQFVWAGYRH